MAESFAPVDVGQMNFSERYADTRQRIADRDAGVREGCRIDDDETCCVRLGCMDPVDQCAFVVALEACQPHAGCLGERGQALIDLSKRGAAVDGRFTRPQQVEVGTVKDEDGGIARR